MPKSPSSTGKSLSSPSPDHTTLVQSTSLTGKAVLEHLDDEIRRGKCLAQVITSSSDGASRVISP